MKENNVIQTLQYLTSDEFEVMNTNHMTDLSDKLLPIVTKMVNTPSQEIKLNE